MRNLVYIFSSIQHIVCSHPGFCFAAVLPEFSQVYNFIGSVFDPDITGHLQKLKKMDPIDVETVCAIMKFGSIGSVYYDKLKIIIM